MPSDAARTDRCIRRWSCGLAFLAAVLGFGLASPALASTAASAVPPAEDAVQLEAGVQGRATRVARRSGAGRPAGHAAARRTGRWPRRFARSLRSLRAPRPRSTRGPPRGPGSA